MIRREKEPADGAAMTKHVTCELCRQQFETERSAADALQEARARFGLEMIDRAPRLAVLCDNCYQLFLEWWRVADLRE